MDGIDRTQKYKKYYKILKDINIRFNLKKKKITKASFVLHKNRSFTMRLFFTFSSIYK